MTSYLDNDHPKSINVRHLGGPPGLVIWCFQNFRCGPSYTVAVVWGGSVVRNGVEGNGEMPKSAIRGIPALSNKMFS
jgi:hypothetical protein